VRIAAPGATTRIAVDLTESPAVVRAVSDLCRDIGTVCRGATTETVREVGGAQVVVGTIGVSPLVDAAIAAGDIDVSGLYEPDGSLAWEGFSLQTAGERLYVVGTDRRGTIYGVYDLCEAMGVSPWWWWGDVPIRPRDHVTVCAGTAVSDRPSVKYRGIFINDEEELDNWARAHTPDGTIGPTTYARLFELVLRLKGNYVWPAMHVNAFNDDPENGRLAHEMGIVIGTSHCDMLLRSNQHEFAPWAAAQDEPVVYDYSIPGRNRELLQQYWRGSVVQNGHYEVSWTVGMRGIHDSGFVTSTIDADQSLSPEAKTAAKVALLKQVIVDQRALLVDELGDRGRDCLQLFVPYKEVLDLYDAGLELPDDVTIVWANDNFGYVRRFPGEDELARSGGHGLYYHSSYWSQPPRSYLATSSTPLALMQNELRKAWEGGIRTLWIDNVGALKPLEIETEFFLRLAWSAGKESGTHDVADFVARWVDANFSGGHGARAGRLYARYYQLNNQRKVEHLDVRAFSQTAYGDEAARRLAALRDLLDETNEILAALPEAERDSFFQLFAVKIHMAYLVSAQFAYADRSALAYRQGRFAAADAYVAVSRRLDALKRAMLHSYNHVMNGGKWRLVLTPEEAPPPAMALHPVAVPALQIGAPGLGVAVWGDDGSQASPRLTFWPCGLQSKWVDVFTTGAPNLDFTVTADDWIEVVPDRGSLTSDLRLHVRVRDREAAVGRSGTVLVTTHDEQIAIAVDVVGHPMPPPHFRGSVEADGYVSIDPSAPDALYPGPGSDWCTVDWLGRNGNAVLEARGRGGATAEFRLHLVTPGAHTLEIHRLPTLNAIGRIRLAVSVDDHQPVTLESPTTDEHRGSWGQAVLDNVERLTIRLPHLEPGEHVLRLHAVDEHVAVSKLVLYTAPITASNLGPAFSHHTDRPLSDTRDPDPAALAVEQLDAMAERLYRVSCGDVPPLPVLFAGAEYTEDGRALALPQAPAAPRARTTDRPKDLLAPLRSLPAAAEVGGRIKLEAEHALAGTSAAWTTPSGDGSAHWTHLQGATNGGDGLAMWVDAAGTAWSDPNQAPGLHYAVEVTDGGSYRAWMLVKFNHKDDDACWLAVDGTPLRGEGVREQLFGWDVAQRWHWTLVGEVDLEPGPHTLSVLAREAGLRIDRIYLTTHDELPPLDAGWAGEEGTS